MIKLIVVCISIISFNTYAQIIKGKKSICTDKTQVQFEQRIYDLESVKSIDDEFTYNVSGIPFLNLQALDMIKSQTIEKLGVEYWLLELRPLPRQTQLEAKFYPRIIMQCERTPTTLNCTGSEKHTSKSRIMDNLTISLNYESEGLSDCNNSGVLKVDYTLVINDREYDEMKSEVFTQLSGSSDNIIAKFMDKVFDPHEFFESYFNQLYQNW